MQSRKKFIATIAAAAGGTLISNKLHSELLAYEKYFAATNDITILHTNDVHSRLEPFPMDGGRNQGLGGVAARSTIINEIKKEVGNTLILDSGDIFQGTPFFNIYKGEPEIKAMTAMGYEACTIGNHDFDAGLENLALQLTNHAKFDMLVANYDFKGTAMESIAKPYKIFKKGGLKIGVFGLGIELEGLVPKNLYGKTIYNDPITAANMTADILKKENCDLIICLSHLGFDYGTSNKVSDKVLAKATKNIDLILGGHTHTFLDNPFVTKNMDGGDVAINQVGFAGIKLGRLDYKFSKTSAKNSLKAHTVEVVKKTNLFINK